MTTAVFDSGVVSSLTGDPSDAAFALDFVTRYRRLLPRRVSRIQETYAGADRDETLDAVLSLKVSSATVGAHELCELATRIEQHVRSDETVLAGSVAALLPDAAARVDQQLGAYLSYSVSSIR